MGDNTQRSAEQYRETAEEIKEVARRTRSPEIHDELFELADRYDRMAAHISQRHRAAW